MLDSGSKKFVKFPEKHMNIYGGLVFSKVAGKWPVNLFTKNSTEGDSQETFEIFQSS